MAASGKMSVGDTGIRGYGHTGRRRKGTGWEINPCGIMMNHGKETQVHCTPISKMAPVWEEANCKMCMRTSRLAIIICSILYAN